MPQTQAACLRYSDEDAIDYTPGSAAFAGDVVLLGTIPLIVPADLAASVVGALAASDVWKVPKVTGAIAAGDDIFWNPTGSPVTGTASTGACQNTGPGAYRMGYAVKASLSGDSYAYVMLQPGRSEIPGAQYSTAALQSAVIPAANMAGAKDVAFENTGTTPANLQLDTAANIVAAIPSPKVGFTYTLAIRNSSGSANTATITTNTGLTLHGTMTIAQNTTRYFKVVLTSLTAIDIFSMGVSAAAA